MSSVSTYWSHGLQPSQERPWQLSLLLLLLQGLDTVEEGEPNASLFIASLLEMLNQTRVGHPLDHDCLGEQTLFEYVHGFLIQRDEL